MFYDDLLFKVYSGFHLNIRPLFNYGYFNIETKETNILVKINITIIYYYMKIKKVFTKSIYLEK